MEMDEKLGWFKVVVVEYAYTMHWSYQNNITAN